MVAGPIRKRRGLKISIEVGSVKQLTVLSELTLPGNQKDALI
jgi:hypothetical protein